MNTRYKILRVLAPQTGNRLGIVRHSLSRRDRGDEGAGRRQKAQEEVLELGRVRESSRGQVSQETEPPEHHQAQGGPERERRALPDLRVRRQERLQDVRRRQEPGHQTARVDHQATRLRNLRRTGVHAQARLLPPRHEAGEPAAQLEGRAQDRRLRPGPGSAQPAALHRLRVYSLVPRA